MTNLFNEELNACSILVQKIYGFNNRRFNYEKNIESFYFVYFMPDCTVLVAMEFTYYLFLREKKVNILKLRSQVIDIFINHVSVIVSGSRG